MLFHRGISYLMLCIYLAAHHYDHVAAIRILILMNCYGITNLLLRKFTFTENQTFLRNFHTTKIWSHTVWHTCHPNKPFSRNLASSIYNP